ASAKAAEAATSGTFNEMAARVTFIGCLLGRRSARSTFEQSQRPFLVERWREEVPLAVVAAELQQARTLLLGLDALGDHVEVEAIGHRGDGPHQLDALGIVGD